MSYSNHTQSKRTASVIASDGFGRGGPEKPGPSIFNIKRKACPMEGCGKPISAKQLTQYGRCTVCIRKQKESAGGQ